ncbi:MAG: IS66 family transposase [Phycisphaeraceae bacterium]|nr:IS66 family transposase [Phycisphaeraceae bacterium]
MTIITELMAKVDRLTRRLDDLEAENHRLEDQVHKLKKNSQNSSKPPSSDIVKPKKKKQSDTDNEKQNKRKIGGQPGHKKHTRPFYTDKQIDKIEKHIQTSCPNCGGLTTPRFDLEYRRVQQIEIKEIPVLKTEHRAYAVWCPTCQMFHYKPFPRSVIKAGLFQERMTTLVAYLKYVCHCSFSTIRKYIRDVLGETVCRGYLRKVLEKVSTSLDDPYDELLKRLPLETIVNADETGHKDKGKKFWTWLFRTDLYVLFKIDKTRSTQVLIDVLGKSFNGTLGCDYFSSYRCYMRQFDVLIQFCLAHLIRDVRFLTNLSDQESKDYGNRILDGIRELFKIIHDRDSFSKASFRTALEQAKKTIIEAATTRVPSLLNKKGKELYNHAKNMAHRFRKHGEAYFTFITTPNADPTNNIAEQAVRFVVIDRHITQGTRGEAGRKTAERLWTVVGTCQLQGRSAFNFIREAVHAYFYNQPSPSLLPSPT